MWLFFIILCIVVCKKFGAMSVFYLGRVLIGGIGLLFPATAVTLIVAFIDTVKEGNINFVYLVIAIGLLFFGVLAIIHLFKKNMEEYERWGIVISIMQIVYCCPLIILTFIYCILLAIGVIAEPVGNMVGSYIKEYREQEKVHDIGRTYVTDRSGRRRYVVRGHYIRSDSGKLVELDKFVDGLYYDDSNNSYT